MGQCASCGDPSILANRKASKKSRQISYLKKVGGGKANNNKAQINQPVNIAKEIIVDDTKPE